MRPIKLGKITIAPSSSGFVISDEMATAHITVCENPRGHLWIHVTEHGSGNRLVNFRAIPIEEFSSLILRSVLPAVTRLLAKARWVRPGWLGRKGFVVTPISSEFFVDKVRTHSPRRKGKYFPRIERILGEFEETTLTSYHPSVLRALDTAASPMAIATNGKKSGLLFGEKGRWIWMPFIDVTDVLESEYARGVEELLKELGPFIPSAEFEGY